MIKLSAPRFWFDTTSPASRVISRLLAPLACGWRAVTALRHSVARPYKSRAAVICVGNTVVGGAGKTPLAMALFTALRDSGVAATPCFVLRGYRGTFKDCAVVESGFGNASLYGDEAMLLARCGRTIVAKNRVLGLKLAEELGHDVVIMDDGFQNPSFCKDVSILAFDGGVGIGNGACLPAGPCREPLHKGVARADAAVIIGTDKTHIKPELKPLPVFQASFKPAYNNTDGRYVAFAGIGRPEKFFETLDQNNFNVVAKVPYPDHHAFSDWDLNRLIALAAEHDAMLITTEKDFIRIPDKLRAVVHVLPVNIKIDGLAELTTLIRTRLGRP